MMQEKYGTPFLRVSYFGVEDMAESLYDVARFFAEQDPEIMARTQDLVREELAVLLPKLQEYRKALTGKRAAIYVGGSFKAFSLVKAFRLLGMQVVMVGSQTGTPEDYQELYEITDEGTIIVDDTNPLELSRVPARRRTWTSWWAASRSGPSPTSSASGSATTTTSARRPWRASWACSTSPTRCYRTVTSPVWQLRAAAPGEGDARRLSSRRGLQAPSPWLRPRSPRVTASRGPPYVSTTNACKLCKPLGACLVFRGIEGAIPFLHGSQGCATYMRRYIISHFREPMDIASSALGEKHAVYGGGPNLKQGLRERHQHVPAPADRGGHHLSHRDDRRRRAGDLAGVRRESGGRETGRRLCRTW